MHRRESEDITRQKYASATTDGEDKAKASAEQEKNIDDKITISRQFKEEIVEPILKYHFRY